MRSVIVEHQGDLGTFKQLPDPTPGKDEVLIRVTVAGVNPVDWKLRDWYQKPMPFTLGQDFAGTVVEIGEGVTSYSYGERVFGIARQHGAYSDLTLVPANDPRQPLCHIPETVGDAEAAAVPTPGLTAMRCVDLCNPTSASVILIVGVMGAVGRITAQLLLGKGVKVIGIGSQTDTDEATKLGIAPYVAYDSPENSNLVVAVRRAYDAEIDAIIDFVHDAHSILPLTEIIRDGGKILSANHAFDEPPTLSRGVVAENANLDDLGSHTHTYLRELAKLLEQGELHMKISKEYDFSSAVAALEQMKSGKAKGKLLLMIE